MKTQPITYDSLPETIGRILEKVENIERQLATLAIPAQTQEEYMNTDQASSLLQITTKSLYNKIAEIPHYKPGKKLLFKREELISYMNKSRKATSSEKEAELQSEVDEILSKTSKRIVKNRR